MKTQHVGSEATARKMMSLVHSLDFENIEQYFDYCAESHINGNFSQCRRLFKDMPKYYRHELINYLRDNVGGDEIHNFYVSQF